MAATVVVSAGTLATATGQSPQGHLFYATNSARWWVLGVLSGSDTTLRSYYSSDLVTWTAGATKTLAQSLINGRNLAATYKNISSADVVSIALAYRIADNNHIASVLRATISGTTITYGTETTVGVAGNTDGVDVAGPAAAFSTSDIAFHANGFAGTGGGDWPGDPNLIRATSADPTLPSSITQPDSVPNWVTSNALAVCATGNVLWVGDNGAGTTDYNQLRFSLWGGASWGTTGNVLNGTLGTAQLKADWGLVACTTTDIHVVSRTGATTYEHRRFNGSTWSAGQSITAQGSKAGAGVFLATDGTDVWLFVVDSDSANTVRYAKWTASGPTWGTWTALESSTKVRTFVTGSSLAVSGAIGVLWTEVNGSNYDIVVAPLGGGGPVTRDLAGAQPAASGVLTRLKAAPRSLAGAWPNATGTLTRTLAALRSLAGDWPTATGVLTRSKANARALDGAWPAATGVLTGQVSVSRSVAGAWPAATGVLTRVLGAVRGLTGAMPNATGVLTRVKAAPRALTGAMPTATGVLSASGVGTRSLAGDWPTATGVLTRIYKAVRGLTGAMPTGTGDLTRSKANARALTGAWPNGTGVLTAQQTVSRSVAGAMPTATGTLTRTTGRVRALTGNMPTATGTLARLHAAVRALAGDMPNAAGALARRMAIHATTLIGVMPSADGTLSRRAAVSRALAGAQPAASGTLTYFVGETDVPGHLTIGEALIADTLIGDALVGGSVLVGDGN